MLPVKVAVFTVTVCAAVAVLPFTSVTVQVTVVEPTGNTEGALLVTVATPQLSAVVGVPSEAPASDSDTERHQPLIVTVDGAVIVGFCASITVTVCVAVAVLPCTSVTVQVTVVVPHQ